MKKAVGITIAIIIALAILLSLPQEQTSAKNNDFLRIHIRADSNSSADQSVKYKVKTAVVEYLVPFVATSKTKQEALATIGSRLREIEEVANTVLTGENFTYKCSAKLNEENFPTRTYDGLTLTSGMYDALILQLGSGKGDNWWCVVYPPLCFVGGEANGTNTITYKSKIKEIIENWKKSK